MVSSMEIFKQINNTVLDLQASNYQTFERHIKKLAQLLARDELSDINKTLISGLDLDDFLERSPEYQGSFAGTGRLDWPTSEVECLGLTILLIFKFANEPDYAAHFSHIYYHAGNKISAELQSMTRQLIIPFARDYKEFVTSHASPKSKQLTTTSNKIFIVHGHDEAARETVARFLERLELTPIILHEQVNRGRTIIEKVEENSDVAFAVVLLTADDEG